MSAFTYTVCASLSVTSKDVSSLLHVGEAVDEAPPPARRSARARPGRPPRPAPPSLPTVAEDEEEQGEEADSAAEPGQDCAAKVVHREACLTGSCNALVSTMIAQRLRQHPEAMPAMQQESRLSLLLV